MKTLRLLIPLLLVSVAHAQPSGSANVKVTDGSRTATVRDTGSTDSLNVAITDGSGNQITSFGGGTVSLASSSTIGPAARYDSASASAASTVLYTHDLSYYRSALIQFTGTWVGTINFECSVDNGTWFACPLRNISSSTNSSVTSTTGNGLFAGPLMGLNWRLKTGAWTSGTVTADMLFQTFPYSPNTVAVDGSFTSTLGDLELYSSSIDDKLADIRTKLNSWDVDGIPSYVVSGSYVGAASARYLDLNATKQQIRTGQSVLFGWYLYNNAASTRFFKIWGLPAASVTVGVTTPFLTIPVPAGSAANVEFSHGILMISGLTVACTTGVADSDTGAPASNDCVANFVYE